MDQFEPITTKEDFEERVNAIVRGRLDRAERKFREDNAEVFEKAAAFDEQSEAAKSELERAIGRAESAEAEVERLKGRAQLREWADEVSAATGVPAKLIRGSTKEDMEAFAEEIVGYASSTAPKAPTVPSEGNRPSSAAPAGKAAMLSELITEQFR